MAGRGPKTTGREGQMDAGLPRGRTLGRKVGGREGDLSTQPPAPASNQEAPSPHHTGAPPFTRPAPGPLGLTPFLPYGDRPGRPCSQAEAQNSGSRRASGWRRMGGWRGQPRLPEERGVPHYAGLARGAGLSASTASSSSSGDAPGLQPSALGDLPASNSLEPWGDTVASVARSGLPVPGGRLGQPPEAWEAHLPSRW